MAQFKVHDLNTSDRRWYVWFKFYTKSTENQFKTDYIYTKDDALCVANELAIYLPHDTIIYVWHMPGPDR